MGDLDKLSEILNERLIVKWSDGEVTLKEKGEEAKLKEVLLKGLSSGSLILKLERAQIQFFKGGKANKRCDYLILTSFDGKKYAIFIELKSTSFDDDYIIQFKSSQCLLDYFDSVLNRFEECNSSLCQYDHRFVVFYKSSINKKPTRSTINARMPNNTPEEAFLYSDPHALSIKDTII